MTVPSATFGFGLYTANETWAASGGHLGVWRDDTWRYIGALGGGSFNLGLSGEGVREREVFEYRLEGLGFVQSLQHRISDSNLWIGARYLFIDVTSSFDAEALPDVDPSELETSLGTLGLFLAYDGRNNPITPDRGLYVKVQLDRWGGVFGGEDDFWSASGGVIGYTDAIPDVVLGLRAEGGATQEESPFWNRPAVSLRGIPGMRYLGEQAGAVEGEVRWDFTARWSLVGFGGGGFATTERSIRSDTKWVGAGGAGFRYLLARAFGMRGDSFWISRTEPTALRTTSRSEAPGHGCSLR